MVAHDIADHRADATAAVVPPPALAVTNLTWSFGGRKVLDRVQFEVMAGEIVLLLGPNGAGKTTLFSLIAGLFAPQRVAALPDNRERQAATANRITLFGQPPSRSAQARRHLGIVFQQPALDLDLTVAQNLRYFCALHGLDRGTAGKRIADELARLGLTERAGERVRALNGGHRRRVEIARANLHRPRLLLLDEPTVGLDIPTRTAVLDDLQLRSRRDGQAILWASHLIDEVERADRVILLHQGQVRVNASPAQLLRDSGCDSLQAAFVRLTERAADAGSGNNLPR